MSTERWSRIEDLFQRAAELPDTDRAAFLEVETGGDPDLRREIESLLAADEATEQFMEKPVIPSRLSDLLERSGSPPVEGHIGPYRLLRQIGEGGMSRVYLAVRDDDEFQKLVAIKVIREGLDGKDVMHRFRTERQILASLDHPHIARLLDGGSTVDGLPYFVMEFIEGEPIDSYCDARRLSVRERIGLFIKVCSAVGHAHQNLIVHRDLKASNILVTREGEPKLLDFGIAKLLKPEQFTLPLDLTSPNVRPLTPFYASPEQIEGGLITTATDVYSLGVLLFKLLTGHFPYRLRTQTLQEVERVVLEGNLEAPSTALSRVEEVEEGDGAKKTRVVVSPDRVSSSRSTPLARLRRQLSGDLDNILLMALRKEPQRRYPSVLQFAQDLESYLAGEPVLAHKDSLGYRASKFLHRNRVATAVAASFLALLIGFSITVSVQASRAARQRDQAQLERDRAENVVGFLQGIFQLSDPMVGGGGEKITAREILDRGAERVERELSDQPEVQATLMEAIGNVYRNLGLFDSAEPLLRRALATREEILGSEHPAVAQSLNNLAIVLRFKGDFAGAEPLFRRALSLRQASLPPRDPDIAQSSYNLARLLREAGRYEEAIPLYRDAVSILRQSPDDRRVDLTAALIDLAILRTNVGDFAGAEPLFREALELRRQAYPDNPLVAEAANDLGVLLGMQERLDEAEPLFRESLAIRTRTLGSDHPFVAETLNNLARLLREKSELDEAEALYRQGIANLRRTHGRNHPLVGTLTNNLAALLQLKGDLAAAEVHHREALDIRRTVLGEQHQDVAVSLKNLGAVLLERGQPAEAETYFKEAVTVFGAVLPPNHWRTAEARSLLGQCLAELGRSGEAEEDLVGGFEALRLSLGAEHRRSQEALLRLLKFLKTAKRSEMLNRYETFLSD